MNWVCPQMPCEPPIGAELSGDVGEHFLSLAQRGELRSARQIQQRTEIDCPSCEQSTGEPRSHSRRHFTWRSKTCNSPAGRNRGGGCTSTHAGKFKGRTLIPAFPLAGGRRLSVLRLRCAQLVLCGAEGLSTNGQWAACRQDGVPFSGHGVPRAAWNGPCRLACPQIAYPCAFQGIKS